MSISSQATITAIFNEKGGIGKTTSVFSLGTILSDASRKAKRKKILLVCNDPSGDLSSLFYRKMVGDKSVEELSKQPEAQTSNLYHEVDSSEMKPILPIEISSHLHLLCGTGSLAAVNAIDQSLCFVENLATLQDDYDHIFIDCPPSFGELFVAAVASASSGGIIIPVSPDELARRAMIKTIQRLARLNKHSSKKTPLLGTLINMVKRGKSIDNYVESFADEAVIKPFKTQLRQTVQIADTITYGESILELCSPREKGRLMLEEFVREVEDRLKKLQKNSQSKVA